MLWSKEKRAFMMTDSTSPWWFQRGIDCPSATSDVTVEGARIRYEVWDERSTRKDRSGVVLIHGSNAHREWWRFLAPMLADQFRVVALDLSGHGDSEWRSRYSGPQQGREVWAVAEAAELGDSPFVVGHSYGGFVALETAHQFSHEMGGLVFMDFTVPAPHEFIEWGLRVEREGVKPGRKLRVYDDLETALGRYRLVPEQPVRHPKILRHLATHSLKAVDGGYTWKFDPGLFDYLEMGSDQHGKFVGLQCSTAVILGEDSKDEAAFFTHNIEQVGGGWIPQFKVPGTHHHLMFDEPVAVAMALKAILLGWRQQAGGR